MLNATQTAQEASIVAEAGQRGKITVATNMAGRGTDIKLARGVAELGGLHVIATEPHGSGRVDRQLFGRAARQGDPGCAQMFASAEDDLFVRHAPAPAAALAHRRRRAADRHRPGPRRTARPLQPQAGPPQRRLDGSVAAVLIAADQPGHIFHFCFILPI